MMLHPIRRLVMRFLHAGVALVVASTAAFAADTGKSQRPNVVFILADDK